MERHVRIGCYSAFWGDTPGASRQLVEAEDARLNYLVADYLAEVTMGLLARASHAPARPGSGKKAAGYIREFVTFVLKPLLPQILEKKIKVVTNAGGLDPVGLKELIEELAAEKGVTDQVKVAAVYGDNIISQKNELLQAGAFSAFNPLNVDGADEAMFESQDSILSLNAYTGAQPITKALEAGANIIVTGRCVDSALVLGPLAYEYSWNYARLDDQATLDRLASASLAGHLVECGAQATGGNFTDWELSAGSAYGGWANMGYPIVTFEEDGTFTVSKPRETGGLVTRHTVGEQMLYEVLDPENYILPDVVVDLSRVVLDQVDKDKVRVTGVRGKPPTEWLKCTAVRQMGFRTTADMLVFGANAEQKGKVLGNAILQRARNVTEMELRNVGKSEDFKGFESKVIIVGAEHSLSPSAARPPSREVVVRIAAKHVRRHVLDVLGREVASFGTSSAPGIAMFSSGRPKVSPNFLASSVLIRRDFVTPKFCIGGRTSTIPVPLVTEGCKPIVPSASAIKSKSSSSAIHQPSPAQNTRCNLLDVAVGRSGDKGDTSNVAFIARNPVFYPYLLDQVTPEVVASALCNLLRPTSTVTRKEKDMHNYA
ncbi:Uncharacterized protein SAPIO_CDS7897 [Scedosporium apiospermum]|uniref:DUF1446 domain-containing protein n=1 Tax=Pseudallescheria apiosperma TaxID=563466 RepID=A0A084G0N6_PSEDA|nr:Uncharacterized protein SAPIO_CDS7897 [Scedosporium apiospermum]KEZ40898.1 Uncharacterized protein SAPIO_CDS7897 [Scedosporium apiospermum]